MKNIIIYSSATKEGVNISAHSIFKASNGNLYNNIIGIDGTITTVAPIDKDEDNINICYVGGLDANGKVKDTRTVEQQNSLDKLFKIFKSKFPKIKVLEDEDSKPKIKKTKNKKDEK
jgi:N-acetylmuramoyl-L-alanine amidase